MDILKDEHFFCRIKMIIDHSNAERKKMKNAQDQMIFPRMHLLTLKHPHQVYCQISNTCFWKYQKEKCQDKMISDASRPLMS